jgi:hypothetical protein
VATITAANCGAVLVTLSHRDSDNDDFECDVLLVLFLDLFVCHAYEVAAVHFSSLCWAKTLPHNMIIGLCYEVVEVVEEIDNFANTSARSCCRDDFPDASQMSDIPSVILVIKQGHLHPLCWPFAAI